MMSEMTALYHLHIHSYVPVEFADHNANPKLYDNSAVFRKSMAKFLWFNQDNELDELCVQNLRLSG